MNTNNIDIDVEKGIECILNHFNQDTLFPRTIMTKKLGHQKEVFSKEEALEFFKKSEYIDCRVMLFLPTRIIKKFKDIHQILYS